MKPWIIMPYDASPVARAVLRRAAQAMQEGNQLYAGIILAITGVDPSTLGHLVQDAQHVAGPDVPLEVRLLNAGDPIGALRHFAESVPNAVLAAPLRAQGIAPWYADTCAFGPTSHTTMLFLMTDKEIARFAEERNGGHRVGPVVGAVLRAGAWLHPSVRAHVKAVGR
jgi:hypothetical protein